MMTDEEKEAARKRAAAVMPFLLAIKKQDLAMSNLAVKFMEGTITADEAVEDLKEFMQGDLRKEFWLGRDRFLKLLWHMSGASVRDVQFEVWRRQKGIYQTPQLGDR